MNLAYFVYFLLHTPSIWRLALRFGVVSSRFRGGFGAASARRSLATLRAVILDRAELARVLGTEVPEGAERVVRGVAYDSRRVEPGFAFAVSHDAISATGLVSVRP